MKQTAPGPMRALTVSSKQWCPDLQHLGCGIFTWAPSNRPKCAVASDHLAGISNRLPQEKALSTSNQGPRRVLRKVKGGGEVETE